MLLQVLGGINEVFIGWAAMSFEESIQFGNIAKVTSGTKRPYSVRLHFCAFHVVRKNVGVGRVFNG